MHAQNIRSLIYVFIITTTIFIMAAAYLSTHAHRKVSTSYSASSKNSTHQKDVKTAIARARLGKLAAGIGATIKNIEFLPGNHYAFR